MFGGLSICSLEAVVGKDDTEHIIEVNDCAMKLMGDSSEEDKQMIATHYHNVSPLIDHYSNPDAHQSSL